MKSAPYCEQVSADQSILEVLRDDTETTVMPSLEGCHVSFAYLATQKARSYVIYDDISARMFVDRFLSSHNEQTDKHLHGIIPAECEAYRVGSCIRKVTMFIYDFDGALSLEAVDNALRTFGGAAVRHTSYNHKKSTTKLERVRDVTDSRDPPSIGPLTDADAKHYCAITGKYSGLTNVVVGNGGVLVSSADGPYYVVHHDPIDKCRVYIFLLQPILLSEVGLDGYKSLYETVGDRLFGEDTYDPVPSNAGAIFFLPAKPVGCLVDHSITHQDGPVFDWSEDWLNVQAEVLKRREAAATKVLHFAVSDHGAGLPNIAAALQHIPPVDFGVWKSVIAAVHHETNGSEEGRALVHQWSALSPAQYDQAAVDRLWDYFGDSDTTARKATYGTLVYHARKTCPDFGRAATNEVSDEYLRF